MAVVHPRLTFDHSILKRAKKRKPIDNKMLQNLKRLLTRDRRSKVIKLTKMVSTIVSHEFQDRLAVSSGVN